MATKSVFTGVVDVLGREIASGVLAEGAVLNLTSLESRFKVSRTVAREAMRQLQSLGMITAKRRVGLIVGPSSLWDVLNPLVIRWRLDSPARDEQLYSLTDLRAAIEPTAARLAASEATGEERTRLVEVSERLVQLGNEGRGDEAEYLATDVEYHRLLLRASHNEMLIACQPAVEAVLVGRTELGLTPRDPDPVALENHRVVARAIVDGDGDQAEEILRRVVRLIRGELPPPHRRDAGVVTAGAAEPPRSREARVDDGTAATGADSAPGADAVPSSRAAGVEA
ncbi:FadR/GntR family transcriptional regulator [Cellulomonas aerilata]|uniref:Transcriptional regulator n=1 Tax=Cellulomonas aerilata TaxID=515326 RepID=A0A512DF44_9CELL|nr:FCD domain-containing protein [Cellulomonas aerilata]GEO35103.1 transcriptional regulator [Cellulomonas aerilata]